MARCTVIVSDLGSVQVNNLIANVNTLILMLETAGASITAGATAAQVLQAWSAGIAVGKDSNPAATANIVSTGRPILGIKPSPNVRLGVTQGEETMTKDSNF